MVICPFSTVITAKEQALFLYLLDVDMKTIYEDYLFTNQVAAKKASRFYWMIRIFKRDRNLAEKARAAFIADQSYLEAALDEITQKFGSLDAYLERQLGITPQMREKFKTEALEP